MFPVVAIAQPFEISVEAMGDRLSLINYYSVSNFILFLHESQLKRSR